MSAILRWSGHGAVTAQTANLDPELAHRMDEREHGERDIALATSPMIRAGSCHRAITRAYRGRQARNRYAVLEAKTGSLSNDVSSPACVFVLDLIAPRYWLAMRVGVSRELPDVDTSDRCRKVASDPVTKCQLR